MIKKTILIIFLCFLPWPFLVAHEHDEHNKQIKSTVIDSSKPIQKDSLIIKQSSVPSFNSIRAPFKDFPNLHPLVVHFPIVLLLIAFLFQIIGLFVYKKPFGYVTLILLFLGFIGAWLATGIFHAQPADLSEHARQVFRAHDHFGMWTVWLSFAGLVFKLISQFLFKLKLWFEIIVLAILLSSAFAVLAAGHLGAQLVYIEGVGPQGHHVRAEDDDD